jgi:hypothetical protein
MEEYGREILKGKEDEAILEREIDARYLSEYFAIYNFLNPKNPSPTSPL